MGVWLCCSSGESEALELPVCTHVELMTVLLVWVARSACGVAAVYRMLQLSYGTLVTGNRRQEGYAEN